MKKLALCLALAGACFLAGCVEPPKGAKASDSGIIYRHHFIGSSAIEQSTNAIKLKEVLARESTRNMTAELFRKLAKAPRQLWTKHLPKNAKTGAEFIEPLLPDILASESYIEARGSTGRPECVIAVKLSETRAKEWDANLKSLASAWDLGKPVEVARGNFNGWEINRRQYPNKLQFLRGKQWVIVGFGSDALPLTAEAAKSEPPVKPLGENTLLQFDADLPRITPAIRVLSNRRLPPTKVTIFGRGEFVRTEAQFRLAQPLNWKFEPWSIPTNMIPDSIVSFTAAQGIAPLLNTIDGVPGLGLRPLPNQLSFWGIGDAQGQIFAAIPVDNATNAIQRLAPTLPKFVLKHFPNIMGNFLWASNRAQIFWQGMPFIVPYLHPIQSAGRDFLFFGMYPRVPTSNQPPAELFAQLGDRRDLAYYDWEITGQRANHARQLYGLAHLVNKRRVPDSKFVSDVWLRDLEKVIGPTITEITVKSPTEVNLVRKSHIGFTGFELATFSLWLESPAFPLGFEPRPRSIVTTNNLPRKASPNAVPTAPNPGNSR